MENAKKIFGAIVRTALFLVKLELALLFAAVVILLSYAQHVTQPDTQRLSAYDLRVREALAVLLMDTGSSLFEGTGGMTENDRLLAVEQAKTAFRQLPGMECDEATVAASGILQLVMAGSATWEELGFSEWEVDAQLRLAWVEAAKLRFQLMLSASHRDAVAHVNFIYSLLDDEGWVQATWEELGFTELELLNRLDLARTLVSQRLQAQE